MLSFPRNLAGLAALASRDGGRFALGALHVLDPDDGTYRVEVTDGRRLAVVRGPCPPTAVPAPDPDLPPAPACLVPVADWKAAFRMGDKARPVGLTAAGARFTLAVGDQALSGQAHDGTFPDVARVLPERLPLVTVRVNPALLAGVLDLAHALEVTDLAVLYYGRGLALGLAGRNDAGQFLDALVMPLS